MIPFIQQKMPFRHRFFMDNDPKHTSGSTREFLVLNNINHCETPPQSPLQPLTFIFIFIFVYFIATVFILGFNGDRDIHNDSYNAVYLNNK